MTQVVSAAGQPQSLQPSSILPVSSTKLNTQKIYEEINQRICLVFTGKRPSTGFLLEDNYLLVASQVLGVSETVYSRDRLPRVEFSYLDVKYTAEYAIHSRLDARPNGNLQFVSNLCLCRILDPDFPRLPGCSMLTEDPTPGEKVYFGGYSSAPGTETVHKGMISCVDDSVREDRNERANFKLDGTLVPGNLGGPVFIQREGEFRLAGIIITDLEDDFIKTKKELEPILMLSVNGASIDNVISTVVTTVFNNFSRGYGRAIHAKHVAQLLENNKTQLSSKDPLFLEWYHECLEGTKLCKEILKAPIFGPSCGQKIKPEEEQKLLVYYQMNVSNNPDHQFQMRNKSLQHFSNLKEKITRGIPEHDSNYLPLPRALRLNKDHWLKILADFLRDLPGKEAEIKELIHLITKERVKDTRKIGYA